MVKRALSELAALLLLIPSAYADMQWKQDTPAQQILKQYIEGVNIRLAERGEKEINSLFEIYNGFAVFGITEEADADAPEEVEITVYLLYDSLNRLELRVSNISRFPAVAAAMIQTLYGENEAGDKLLKLPAERAEKALKEPDQSYEEPVEELNGSMPHIYYAYYPNPYRDGVNWIQMTIVFPLPGEWDGESALIGQPSEKTMDPNSGVSEDYEGYYSTDDYSHLEVFTTPTPEPDSAAAEYDFR